MDAIMRRRMMMAEVGGSPTPPEPPVQIAYIRGGTNGSYIDTGIIPDSTTKVIVWARNFNSGGGILFGSQDDSSTCFWIGALGGTATNHGNIFMAYGTWGSTYPHATDQFRNFGGYHKYELYQGAIRIDDETVVSTSASFSGNTRSIFLFGANFAGTLESATLQVDICACKIYKGGVLVRDYTAVNSPSVGLYDAVSDTVFTNAGSGSFTYGTFNQNAYTPLEYITTYGASAFITPAIGSYSLPIVIKFHPTGTSKSWFSPLGGRSATERCEIFTGDTSYSNALLYSVLGTKTPAMYSSNTAGAVRKDLVVVKKNNTFTALYNNAVFGSAKTFNVGTTYSTGAPIGIGATWQVHASSYVLYFVGNIYYVGLGAYNLVPAKVGGVAGMYETYNDIFYPSTTSTPFTAGPNVI